MKRNIARKEAMVLGGVGRGMDNKKSRTTKHNHDRLVDKRRRIKGKKEIVEAMGNIRARLKTIAPPPPPKASLQPFLDAIRAAREAEELAEFKAFVEGVVMSEDWDMLQ